MLVTAIIRGLVQVCTADTSLIRCFRYIYMSLQVKNIL